MAKYSLIQNSDDAILERAREFENSTPDDPRTLTQKFGPGFLSRWVPFIVDVVPAFDPATEKLVASDVVNQTEHHFAHTVTALTVQELAAIADNADREAKRINVSNAVATLRTWATQAGNVTVTQGNAVSTLQTMVDRMGIFFDRFADLIEGQRFDSN